MLRATLPHKKHDQYLGVPITGYFGGPRRAISQACTFNDNSFSTIVTRPTYSDAGLWSVLILFWSSSKVKVNCQSSKFQEENAANIAQVVGATSSVGFSSTTSITYRKQQQRHYNAPVLILYGIWGRG